MARKPSLTTESIKREIQADDAARKAKAAARRAEKAAAAAAAKQAITDQAEANRLARIATKDVAAEAHVAIQTMATDFEAITGETARNEDGTLSTEFVEWFAEQGFNPDGSVKTNDDQPVVSRESKAQYTGPMLALRTAAKTYITGKNGNPHCADPVAMALDGLTREQVVECLGRLLLANAVTTSVNPYAALNPGQQSMNLRNKLRGALKNGLVNMAKLDDATKAYK